MSSKTRSPTILCNGTTYNRTEKSECDFPTPAPTYPAPTLSNSRSRLSDPGSQLSHSSSQLTDSSTYLSDSFRLRVLPLRLQLPIFRLQLPSLRLQLPMFRLLLLSLRLRRPMCKPTPFATTQLLPMSGRPASFAFVLSSSSLPLVLYTFVSHASIFWALRPHPAAPPRCKTQAESESESESEAVRLVIGDAGMQAPCWNMDAWAKTECLCLHLRPQA